MKPILFLLLASILTFSGFAQIGGEDEVYLSGDRIEAKFQGGGIDNFSNFLNKEFDYSKVTKPGKMVGAFTIDVDGNVKNIKIIQFFDIESAAEFIRVLKKCPKWEPAKRGGKPFSIEIKYPMVFNAKQNTTDESTVAKNNQVNSKSESKTNQSDIIDEAAVERKPLFAGGLTKFYAYVASSFGQPEMTSFKGGRMIVSFVVEKDGSLTDIKIIKDIGFGTADEAIRVLKASPKWTPAQQNGKPVRCIYTLPIKIAGYKGE